MVLRNWLAGMFPGQGIREAVKRRRGWQAGGEVLERRELLTATFDFAFGLGGDMEQKGQSVVIDEGGNTYVAGGFQGTVDFDPGTGVTELTADGSFKDLFLAKYNAAGELQWVGSVKNGVLNRAPGLALTPTGDVVVTGPLRGVADFDFGTGSTTLDAGATGDTYVAKYSPNGSLIWTKQFGGIASTGSLDAGPLTVDESGNIYSAGLLSSGNADFDPGTGSTVLSTTEGNGAGYLAKLDLSGNFVWAKLLVDDASSDGRAEFIDLKVDEDQNVYGTGTFFGTIDFDPGSGTTTRTSSADFDFDGFLIKLTPTGDLSHIVTLGGASGPDLLQGLAIDDAGNSYVTGLIRGTSTLAYVGGSTVLSSAGNTDIVVAKLTPTGGLSWVERYGSTSFDEGYDIALRENSTLYVTGIFSNTVDFDSSSGTSNLSTVADSDTFLLKLTTDGIFEWAAAFQGEVISSGESVAVNSSGQIAVSGFFDETVDFDPGVGIANRSSIDSLDGYLVRLTDDDGVSNTAPTLDNAGDPELPGLAEDAVAASITGARVSDIIASMAPGSISDADAGAVQGIAVVGANQLSGKWQFSLDDGTNWTDFGATSSSAALLLAANASTRVRYLPNPNTTGTVGFTFVAWDQTSGTNGTKVAALLANRGGSSAFSPEKEDVFVTVAPSNDAPVLARNVEVKLPSIEPNSAAGNGVLLSTLIAGAPVDLIRDADKNALEGIAVLGANQAEGTWQYSVNGGTNWTPFGSTSPSQSLLLAANPNTRVRFVSTTNRVVTPGFTYVAWDQTSGANGGTADASTQRGGTTAFSLAKGVATIEVKGSNVAPVLNPAGSPTLDGIASNVTDANNVGTLISDLIARMSPLGGISDADAGALKGIAIIGANQLSGTWQFTTNGGTTWTNIGATSGGNARLLASNANTRLRFKPNAGFTGTPGVTFIAWDQSSGANGTLVDASVRGGVSAFSVKKDVATVAVS